MTNVHEAQLAVIPQQLLWEQRCSSSRARLRERNRGAREKGRGPLFIPLFQHVAVAFQLREYYEWLSAIDAESIANHTTLHNESTCLTCLLRANAFIYLWTVIRLTAPKHLTSNAVRSWPAVINCQWPFEFSCQSEPANLYAMAFATLSIEPLAPEINYLRMLKLLCLWSHYVQRLKHCSFFFFMKQKNILFWR